MPTIMLIIIWGTFLLMSVGIAIQGAMALLNHASKTTIIKTKKPNLKDKLEHTKRRADKKRGQKIS